MKRFYKVMMKKVPIGRAAMYKMPPLDGEILLKITDAPTKGDYNLTVTECDDENHNKNISLENITDMEEKNAIELAAEFQPESIRVEVNPKTKRKKKITIPALDLTKYLSKHKKVRKK